MTHIVNLSDFHGYRSEDVLATAMEKTGKRKFMKLSFYPMENSFFYVVGIVNGEKDKFPNTGAKVRKFTALDEAVKAYSAIP